MPHEHREAALGRLFPVLHDAFLPCAWSVPIPQQGKRGRQQAFLFCVVFNESKKWTGVDTVLSRIDENYLLKSDPTELAD